MKKLCSAVALATVLGLGTSSAFTVITGSVNEFGSADDLNLDSSLSVIAVDIYGNGDSTVNGVTFLTDRAGLGAGVGAEGVVTNGGVTLTTNLFNQIDNWTAAPLFTGTDAGALAGIMQDIRWANGGAGQTISIGVGGLTPNTPYNVLLLFNEGANRDRHFDIGVNGLLAVDDMTSEGNGVWTNSNSFSYNGTFSSTNAGGLDIVLGREPLPGDENNTAFTGADTNAILQGIVISRIPEPSSSALLGLGLIGLLARRRR